MIPGRRIRAAWAIFSITAIIAGVRLTISPHSVAVVIIVSTVCTRLLAILSD
jgi:hypothetical protein